MCKSLKSWISSVVSETYCDYHDGIIQETKPNEWNGIMEQNWKSKTEATVIRDVRHRQKELQHNFHMNIALLLFIFKYFYGWN